MANINKNYNVDFACSSNAGMVKNTNEDSVRISQNKSDNDYFRIIINRAKKLIN